VVIDTRDFALTACSNSVTLIFKMKVLILQEK
jgi:hypothetical protein